MYWSILSEYFCFIQVEISDNWINEMLFLKIAFRFFYGQFSKFQAPQDQISGVARPTRKY